MNNSRRNDALSRSVAISSNRSSHKTAMEVLGNNGRNHRRGLSSTLEIKDIIESGERCSGKIGAPFIPQI